MEKASLNLLCLIFPIFFTYTFAQLYHFCINGNGNYTTNSTYQKNLNILLSSLPSNSQNDQYGFYNISAGQIPDKVNGILLCRGDVTQDICRSCFTKSAQELPQLCPNQKEAIIWYDECMLRYKNSSIYGISKTSPSFYMRNGNNASNVTQFNPVLGSLMNRLSREAGSGGSFKKFATGKANVSDFQSIYGLAQCTPDISQLSCVNCLEGAIGEIPTCCDSKIGGRVVRPSCNIRYEVYQFFTSSTAAADAPAPLSIPPPTASTTNTTTAPGKKNNTSRTVITIVVPVVSFVVVVILACMVIRRRKPRRKLPNPDDIVRAESLQLDLTTIQTATNNFSHANKLGQGGFGSVYKGVLPNGQEIAVKRLAKNSGQGELEFKNEVLLVAKLQHRNLVRLQGFCLEREERLLIYEFVPNASLDHFIFDPTKRDQLDWGTRYKIIGGIARGLLYLHEDSRLRIIHRDLKASNILLDEEMNAKISDFGMAKLFAMDQTQGATSRIVGTYGYMSPEYAMHGQFSVKSDVFSFGVLILEIVSGQKNSCFRHGQTVEDLLSYAWKNWREGTVLNIVDPKVVGGSRDEIMRCIHIGLLCAQENVAERPTMASVVLMLNSYSLTLPVPSQPPFFLQSDVSSYSTSQERGLSETKSIKSTKSESAEWSKNSASITELEAR